MPTETPLWNPNLYSEKHGFVFRYGEALLDLLQVVPGQRVLDLGCGTGELTAKIADLGAEVIGLDHSPEMVAAARARYPEIEFVLADASQFTLNGRPLDIIFSNASLHWVLDAKGCIRSMFQNLKSKGKIVLEFGGKDNVATIIDQLRKTLQARGYREQANVQPYFFPSPGEYTMALEEGGFQVQALWYFDRPTPLADPNSGMTDWLRMFGGPFFVGLPPEEVPEILEQVQASLRPSCFRDGIWYADYKRLRLVAIKQDNVH